MPFPDDLTARLPAPRDDEPPELRERIVKELRDHLQCALHRELVLTGNESEAARRVIAKFGDPARLARKLWFDAMWGKIMTQRILVGLCVFLTVACLTMGALVWNVARQNGEIGKALAAQGAEARRANDLLAERLNKIAASAEAQLAREQIPLRIRLVQESAEGPPAVGFKIRLWQTRVIPEGQGLLPIEPPFFEGTTLESGVTEVGPVSPGDYRLDVFTPWPDQEGLTRIVSIRSGRSPHEELVICPEAPPPAGDAAVEIDWPDDLKQDPVALLWTLGSTSTRTYGGERPSGRQDSWSTDGEPVTSLARSELQYWLIRPDGRFATIKESALQRDLERSAFARNRDATTLIPADAFQWREDPRVRVVGKPVKMLRYVALLSNEGARVLTNRFHSNQGYPFDSQNEFEMPTKPGEVGRWRIHLTDGTITEMREALKSARNSPAGADDDPPDDRSGRRRRRSDKPGG